MKKYWVVVVVVAVAGILLACPHSFAQTNSGQIKGLVLDPNDSPIAGASVRLVNELNAGERSDTTNGQGEFVFASLQPGTYDLYVTAQGFMKFAKRNLVLSASDQLSAGSLHLQIGAASQTVEVQAEITPVQTESGERSALLDEKQIETLLDPARNFLNLTRVLPGVVATSTEGQDQLGIYGMDTVNGQRSEYSTVSMDGVNANTNTTAINRVQTPLNTDAIAETKILSNNYQAEDGGTSGSSINAVTKSGARDFHGTAYYFKRHEEFNANDYFNSAYWNGTEQPKGVNRFNTVGYNIGGPVLIPKAGFNKARDRLFFFFSQEIWPTVHPGDGNPLRLRVPTAEERQGIFSTPTADPQKTAEGMPCQQSGDPGCFPNNTIPSSRIDPNMLKLLALLPAPTPNYADPSGLTNYILNLTERNPVNQQVLRLDWNISPKWRTYFRGLNMSVGSKGNASAYTPMQYLSNFPVDYINSSPNVIWDVTYIASPTLVNEVSFGYAAWSEQQQFPKGKSELAAVQKKALGITLGQFRPEFNPLDLIPGMSFGGGGLSKLPTLGFTGADSSRFPINSQSSSYGLNDGLTKVWRSHVAKAGIYIHNDRFVQRHSAGNFAGAYDFSVNTQNPLDTGNTFANELLGNFFEYSESTSAPDVDPHTHVLEWYVQDSWKVRKTFTLEYGLRFSYDVPQSLHSGANFVPGAYDAAQKPVLYHPGTSGGSTVAIDPRNGNQANQVFIGAVVPGSGDPFDGMVTIKSSHPVMGQGLLVGPRIGFAWDVFGDGKTSVRGGAGIFNNSRTPSPQAGSLTTNPPVQENPIHPFGSVSQLFSSPDNSVIFPTNLHGAVQRNGKWPVFYNYSLGIQRSVGFSSVLDVAYVGNLGRHLGQSYDLNALPPGTRFLTQNQDPTAPGSPLSDNFLRTYVGLGKIPYTEFGGTSNYTSLQIALTRRFSRGFSLGANYVWSKALDYTDTTVPSSSSPGLPTFAPRHAYSYGLANYDRDHSVVINWLWDVPQASKLWDSVVMRQVFDHWQVSGIASFVRGAPQGIALDTGGVDLTGGTDAPRAMLSGNPVLSHGDRHALRYFNTSLVHLPPVNTPSSNGQYATTVGNAGKVVFRGPGTNNWNVALFKNFPIHEKVNLQLRGEFYNLFNHPSFNSVDNNAVFTTSGQQTNGTFGFVNSDAGPRQVQLAGRISF
jgi:hypothetical protein